MHPHIQKFFLVRLILLALSFLLTACSSEPKPTHSDAVGWLRGYSGEQLGTIKFASEPVGEYVKMTDYALDLSRNTTQIDSTIKGQALLTALSIHLTTELKENRLDHTDEKVISLLTVYANNGYRINVRVSNFMKLANNACSGNYVHIYSRFSTEWYFAPVIGFLIGFLLFYIATFFPYNWQYRRTLNRSMTFFVLSALLLVLLFKVSCKRYVTDSSFYGIRL